MMDTDKIIVILLKKNVLKLLIQSQKSAHLECLR